MIYDIALNKSTHDIVINDNDVLLIGNAERVAQQIKITLWEWYGEWFLDSTQGIPYLEYITVKNPNINHIKSILSAAMLAIDGVTSVDSMTMDFDKENRQLTVTYTATTSYGLVTDREVLGYGN